MPEDFRDTINRVLRDHEGYTGDGRGGMGDLPIGDRSTEHKPIRKRDLREAMTAVGGALLGQQLTADQISGLDAALAEGRLYPDGSFYSNGPAPIAEPPRATRAFLGEARNFTGATRGNNVNNVWPLYGSKGTEGGATVQAEGGTDQSGYFLVQAATASVATGRIGLTGASRDTSTTTGIGIGALGRLTSGQNTWATYIQAERNVAGGSLWGMELGVYNYHAESTTDRTPYNTGFQGQSLGIHIQCGGATPSTEVFNGDVGVLFHRAPNDPTTNAARGAAWRQGILFTADALAVRADGTRYAVGMPRMSALDWYVQDGSKGARILSTVSLAEHRSELRFNDAGVSFLNDAGHPFLSMNNGPNGVAGDYIQLNAGTAGGGPAIRAEGPGADVDLRLFSKGVGKIRFGTRTATADAPITGYIEVKAEDGTVCKLAVIA